MSESTNGIRAGGLVGKHHMLSLVRHGSGTLALISGSHSFLPGDLNLSAEALNLRHSHWLKKWKASGAGGW